MWLLRLLPWCFIISLVQSADVACNGKMPVDSPSCVEIIRWKHRNDKEATSTCLEYFPTTFLEGKSNDAAKTEIKCTVYRQFQCNHIPNSLSMFDKCYTFIKKEISMADYEADGHKSAYCDEKGALPVFFTMSQGKHIAMQAHRLGFEKIWVNLNSTGQTIDVPTDEASKRVKQGFLLYKNLWKVHDEVYWDGDNLKITPKEKDGPNKGKPKLPDDVTHLFFRSRTDYVYNLYQGSFERVKKGSGTKANVVCEYPAKIVPNQKRYCEKLGKNGLGLNAAYDDQPYVDDTKVRRLGRKRCVYTTLSKFSLKGSDKAIKEFTGCKESPSNEHISGIDDGTASKEIYDKLTASGTYRVAAIKAISDIDDYNANRYAGDARTKCQSSDATEKQRMAYRIYDHFGKRDYSSKMTSTWTENPKYPKAECSDFPDGENGDSNTLAIKNREIIDVPVPVRLNVICSIEANRDCELNKNVCEKSEVKNQICQNVDTWQKQTNLYAQCICGDYHVEYNKDCAWRGRTDNYGGNQCALLHPYQGNYEPKSWRAVFKQDTLRNLDSDFNVQDLNDQVDKVIVRRGCRVELWSHLTQHQGENYMLINATYGPGEYGDGKYLVPQHNAGTSNGWHEHMSASSFKCICPTADKMAPWAPEALRQQPEAPTTPRP